VIASWVPNTTAETVTTGLDDPPIGRKSAATAKVGALFGDPGIAYDRKHGSTRGRLGPGNDDYSASALSASRTQYDVPIGIASSLKS
jgi:hypothetical protein